MLPRLIAPLGIATCLALAGCASLGYDNSVSAGHEAFDARISPIDYHAARPMLAVMTNRPASIAVFEIVPGQGAALVHPSRGSGTDLHRGGVAWIDLDFVPGRWMYEPNLHVYQAPRYYLLVASPRGLNLGHLRASTAAIRSSLGYRTFTSFSPNQLMESLVQLTVGDRARHDYVTDVYVHWPMQQPLLPRYAGAMGAQATRCPDGRVVRWIFECTSVAITADDPRAGDTTGVQRGDAPNRPRPMPGAGTRTRPSPEDRVRTRPDAPTGEGVRETRTEPPTRPSPPVRERPRPAPDSRPSPPPARERSRPQPETRPAPAPRPAPPPQPDNRPDTEAETPALS